MKKSDIGLIGLAVMGENLVMNMESKGFTVSVYNRTTEKVDRFLSGRAQGKNIVGAHSLEELVSQLEKPRKVMMMVKAGAPVDAFIEQLIPLLEPGDVIIDGGNSHFPDTIRRTKYVESKGLYYIGTGVSGGEEGALKGPSIMPGGSPEAWPLVKPIFQAICAKVEDGSPCCQWVGSDGAGHFVKMVHNGIEYGDMQLICEAYQLMKDLLGMTPDEMHEVFAQWNEGELNSYLIEITRDILAYKDENGEHFVREVSEGVMDKPIDVEVNRLVVEGGYDLILSIGQVVPHEVVGMANHSKNIFVGCGGSSMINSSHILGAFYGMERMMGRDHTPVRKVFDYALAHFLSDLPLSFLLTVTTAPGGEIHTHGVFLGADRSYFEDAVALAQEKNLILMDQPIQKAVVYLNPAEFHSTWLGNKAVYRTRMAIADGGELLILAPGIEKFGEDPQVDQLIRKYGYCGRENVIRLCQTQQDLRENLSAAAHLIHGSSDGRFSITYCTEKVTKEEVEGVCFGYLPYREAAKRYDPDTLTDGWHTLPDGETIFYISNPALGLWANRDKFRR